MRVVIFFICLLSGWSAAWATPGVGDPVYGARIETGITEIEARYGRLTSGGSDGEDGLVLEIEHGFTPNFAAAILLETSRTSGTTRTPDAVAIEAIHTIATVAPLKLDIALYGEYKHGLRDEADAVEMKLLLQHSVGRFDSRLNLIAEKPLEAGQPVGLGYAASLDWRTVGELRLGVTAFGDLGTTDRFGGRQEHFVGPTAKIELEHIGGGDFEVEGGWLAALGAARDRTGGQARLLIAYERHF